MKLASIKSIGVLLKEENFLNHQIIVTTNYGVFIADKIIFNDEIENDYNDSKDAHIVASKIMRKMLSDVTDDNKLKNKHNETSFILINAEQKFDNMTFFHSSIIVFTDSVVAVSLFKK